jgi:predicted dehydrogenase
MTETSRRDFLIQTAGALAVVALVPELAADPPRRTGAARKVAVIGIGRQGRAILSELQKLDAIEIAAVCDVVPARVSAGIERAPGAEGFTDHRALLERRIDIEAIIVATPTHLHADIVTEALGSGRHVYCEAPIAATIEDCRRIVDAAAAATTICQAGFQARSNPLYRRAWSLLRAGSLREIVSLYAQHQRKTSWRFPAAEPALERAANWRLDPAVSIGLAGELGAHQFDVMHWLRGSYPVRVDGLGSIRLHRDGRTIADTIEARLVWPDGVALDYRATLASSLGGVHEVLHGSHGSVRLAWSHGWLFKEADAPTEGWEVYATRQPFHTDEGIVLIADATQLAAQGRLREGIGLPHPSLYYALADFVRSLTENAPPACTAEEGMRATIVGILTDQAIVRRSSVDIPALA